MCETLKFKGKTKEVRAVKENINMDACTRGLTEITTICKEENKTTGT